MTQTNKTFYSVTNILKWLSIVLISISFVTLIMVCIIPVVRTFDNVFNYSLFVGVLLYIQLLGVAFWSVVNIIIIIMIGKTNSHKITTTRSTLSVALVLVLGSLIFQFLLTHNVFPEFGGARYLIMFLPLIEIIGIVFSLVWSCMARKEMK